MRAAPLVLAAAVAVAALAALRDEDPDLGLARGSLASAPPPGESLPPPPAFVAPQLRPPIPTNRWWSSLVALPFSERQYPHPLAVAARAEGLQVRYPGPDLRANADCICGWMDFEPPSDLILGHSEVPRFEAARLAGYSDWFVTARFEAIGRPGAAMEVSYGHGSPFVFASFRGGDPVVRFPAPPEVFHESADGSVVGVCRDRRCYLLVGPPGSRWSGLGGADAPQLSSAGRAASRWRSCRTASARALALLFARYARSPVKDTTVSWSYDEARSRVRVRFAYALEAAEGAPAATLFALYPHQRAALVDAPPGAGARELRDGARAHVAPRRGRLRARAPLPGRPARRCRSSRAPTSRRCGRSFAATAPGAPARATRTGPGRSSAASRRSTASRASSGSRPRRTHSRPGCERGSSPGSTPASTPRIQRRAGAFSTTRAGGR